MDDVQNQVGMTKDDIINILKRKKKEAIKYSNEWANKSASNDQYKLMNECWSSWNDGQAKAFELAISIVSMLDNPHNRSSKK